MSIISYLKLKPKPEFRKQFLQQLDELRKLAHNHPGYINSEVLHPDDDSDAYVILSEWETEDAFRHWEHSARHQEVMDNYNDSTGEGYTKMRMERYR